MTRLGDAVGRLLPESDPSIEALSTEVRATIAQVWRERAASELGAARGFAHLAFLLLESTDHRELHFLVARAVSDEVRHAELCRQMASRYAGSELPWPRPRELQRRRFEGIAPELHGVVQVVGVSCIQETLGGAYLERCLEEAESPTCRAALRALLADEVDHGRIGWAYLASLPQALREALGDPLPAVLEGCLGVWADRLRELPQEPQPAHGCPDPVAAAEGVRAAARDLLLPGFAHVGVPTGPLERFVNAS